VIPPFSILDYYTIILSSSNLENFFIGVSAGSSSSKSSDLNYGFFFKKLIGFLFDFFFSSAELISSSSKPSSINPSSKNSSFF